ncbi:MAG: hypothetical protein ACYCPE_08250, partial [Metallibacterium sp.]
DRRFRKSIGIGHDQAKSTVTPYRNDRSHLGEINGHDGPKYAQVWEREIEAYSDWIRIRMSRRFI